MLQKEDPSITNDNFLNPFFFPLKAMEISELQKIVEQEVMRHDNYYIYESDLGISKALQLKITKLIKIFFPRQPIWRFYILANKVQRITGIKAIKRARSRRNVEEV